MKSTAALPGSTCGQRCVSSPSWSVVSGWGAPPSRRHARQSGCVRQGGNDGAILAPAAAARVAHVGDCNRRPPLHRHLPQFVTRKERNPLSVGRKKWLVCAFSSLQQRSVRLIDAPRREHRLAIGAPNGDGDSRAVRRKRKHAERTVGQLAAEVEIESDERTSVRLRPREGQRQPQRRCQHSGSCPGNPCPS